MIGREEADNLTDISNVRQKGTRLGNWLTREQAKELLAVPDRSKLKGKRDYVIIALLVGCALRRQELASLKIEDIQLRVGRLGDHRSSRQGRPYPDGRSPNLGKTGNRRLDGGGQAREGQAASTAFEIGQAGCR